MGSGHLGSAVPRSRPKDSRVNRRRSIAVRPAASVRSHEPHRPAHLTLRDDLAASSVAGCLPQGVTLKVSATSLSRALTGDLASGTLTT